MAKKTHSSGSTLRWVRIGESVHKHLPHLYNWLTNEEDFVELRLKARADGTTLAILKGFGSDGGPIVCFGSGYGTMGALLAIDATIQGGRWKADKPWDGQKG